jgi:hypothetical protein
MEFDYRKEPDHTRPKKDWIKRPKVQARISYGDRHEDLICLVDSGADDCMFHSSIADLLGIDLKTGKLKRYGGVGAGMLVEAYLHDIELEIYGLGDRISISAAFSEQFSQKSGLLGQSGVFETYQILFEGYKGKFSINLRP